MLKSIIENFMKEQQEKMEQEIPKGLQNAIEDIKERIITENNSDILEGVGSAEKVCDGIFGEVYKVKFEFTSIEFKEDKVKVIEGEVISLVEVIQ